nr:hypothetical protein [Nanoarchaeota archaeon]
NMNFSGVDRIEFQSPYGAINNASFINFSLIDPCPAGSSIRQIYSNGTVECEADDFDVANLSNYALANESETFEENITVTNYGFFGWLGSLASRINSLFVTNVNTLNLTLNGSTISSWEEVNYSTSGVDTVWNITGNKYLVNSSGVLIINETILNNTINSRDTDTTYSHLSNFTDDLGDRGYTNNLNFTNGANYWNSTYAAFNKTYADTLYYGLANPFGYYNLTTAPIYVNDTFGANDSTYLTLFNWNKTYADTLYAGIGNISYVSKYTSGSFNGSLYTVGADPIVSDSNSIFQILGNDGTPRFQIQNGGNEQANFIARSFMVVNQNDTRLNQSQNNLCSDWGFTRIDCNSSTTGADMGVQDDFEVQGITYTREGIYGEVSDWGVYTFMGNLSDIGTSGSNGTFTDANNYFCDDFGIFSQANEDDENWLKIESGIYEGAIAEVSVYINSSCIKLSGNPAWSSDLVNQEYKLISNPVFVISDGGSGEFYVGDSPESKFELKILNGTGAEGFAVNDVVGADQHKAMRIDADTNGFDGVSTLLSKLFSTSVSESTDTSNVFLEFLPTNFNNSYHKFIDAIISGEKATGMVIDLFRLQGDFDSYIRQGDVSSILEVYYDNGNGTTTDITSSAISTILNVTIFENDNSTLYLGGSTNFTQIIINLVTPASSDIISELYYCNSSGEWEVFSGGVSDTTVGLTTSGSISVVSPSNRGACNKEIDGTPFVNTTSYNYMAIKRTEDNLVTKPVELSISIGGGSDTFILAEDFIKLNGIVHPPFTCTADVEGALYYDLDSHWYCVCDGTQWEQLDDATTATGCV